MKLFANNILKNCFCIFTLLFNTSSYRKKIYYFTVEREVQKENETMTMFFWFLVVCFSSHKKEVDYPCSKLYSFLFR